MPAIPYRDPQEDQVPDWRKQLPGWAGPPPVKPVNYGDYPQPQIPLAKQPWEGDGSDAAPPVDATPPPVAAPMIPPQQAPPDVRTGPRPDPVMQATSAPQPGPQAPPPVRPPPTPEQDNLRDLYRAGPKTSVLGTLAGLAVRGVAGWASSPGRPAHVNEQRLQDWSQRSPTGGPWSQKVAQQQALAGMEASDIAKEQARQKQQGDAEYLKAHTEQARAEATEANARAADFPARVSERQAEAKTKADEVLATQKRQAYAARIKGREDSVLSLQPGETPPEGWQIIDHPDGGKVAIPPATAQVPQEMVPYMPGHRAGDVVSRGEYRDTAKVYREEMAKRNEASAKPEAAKAEFQRLVAKGTAGAGSPPLTDLNKLGQWIRTNKNLTAAEQNSMLGYLSSNTTPAATGTNTTVRVEGMASTRENPVYDTKSGALMYLSSADINKANQAEPGRYAPAGPGMHALTGTARIEDIRGSIRSTRESLATIPEFTRTDKILIANALRDRDPKSAIGQLISGTAANNMTPAQQEYLINLAQLHEQAMAMRTVLGTGSGAEDLRAAILRTIPGPGTPNKKYAVDQLNAFEATLNRLAKGLPNMPLRGDGGPPPPPDGGRRGGGGRTYVREAAGPNGHMLGQTADGSWYDKTTGQKAQ